ncbi:hypothetical protein F383_16727 [Gossypium arboreum]|uniref:Uncharacterized protein n=1 Tax=Gossypium arboreum TaxID=29729 RepID=A0A0B0MKE9_GOSAR|nr:hypothetical protein F383_16727 [Gossypium arboreum]
MIKLTIPKCSIDSCDRSLRLPLNL